MDANPMPLDEAVKHLQQMLRDKNQYIYDITGIDEGDFIALGVALAALSQPPAVPDRDALHRAAGAVLDQFGEIIGVAQVECIWRSLAAAPPSSWRPIAEAQPGGNLVLGNARGVYASDRMPEKWVRGFIREDGTAWDDEGYPLRPTHFFVMPNVPTQGAEKARRDAQEGGK